MSNNKIKSLEIALSRHIDPENFGPIKSRGNLDDLGERFANKRSAIEGMKAYLKSNEPAPRVLGLLIYSKQGRAHLRSWVDQGMDINLIYHAMTYEGSFWAHSGLPFPLTEEVVKGDQAWDFEARRYLPQVDLLLSVPGLVEAMIGRLREKGQTEEVFKYFPLRVVRQMAKQTPSIIAPEIARLPDPVDTSKDGWEYRVASDLLRVFLDPQTAVEKMLGKKIA